MPGYESFRADRMTCGGFILTRLLVHLNVFNRLDWRHARCFHGVIDNLAPVDAAVRENLALILCAAEVFIEVVNLHRA